MHDFIKPLLDELAKNRTLQRLDPYINDLVEMDSLEALMRECPYWMSWLDMQHVTSLFQGPILRPVTVPCHQDMRRYGRLDVFSNGTCVFMISDYERGKGWMPRIFMWKVCAHTCTMTTLGRCYHKYTCTKCGYSYTIDSSD
jgi:hypothetical protein